ncbi:TatD family deoxyribonuclease [Coraliomargarita sinensis]|uniref:TatD family deoxyribonuclease n=1 Tax=Coraliomargarita sinensis TaxID=2174842 RepID=A0A317ZPC5_9BACT|nr:TatD family hydrolase [Coraliomargarita sinensis]PXA05718.1 TatD family deoxyribonuclease [Coraliomargarita sinensis]
MLIDTHCHIDRFPAPEALVNECESANIKVIAVTNLPSHYEMALPHLANSEHVFPALGFHPLSATSNPTELRTFRKYAGQTKYIGEIGLDFSKAGSPTHQQQEEVFDYVLSALRESPSFITLHSRGAEKEVLEGLQHHDISRACFHWYSGGIRVLEDIVSAGHFISINPAMLDTQKGKRILEIVPLPHLLAESDGPYAKRNRKPCAPLGVMDVYQAIAVKHQLGLGEVDYILEENFKRASKN